MSHWTSAAKEAAHKAGRIWAVVGLVVAVSLILVALSPGFRVTIGGTTYEVRKVVPDE